MREHASEAPGLLPIVSVIMPIKNEASFIERTLGAVLKQDYAGEIEVIIADGGSDDGTIEIVRRLVAEHDSWDTGRSNAESVVLIENPNGIVPTGFNAALKRARGDVIVRVDGHTVIATDYVKECVLALLRSGAENVGGRMAAVGLNAFGEAAAEATSSRFGVGASPFHYSGKEQWVDTVYLGAWPRATFVRVGGFDEELVRNQDDEFNYRLLSAGGRILLSPRINSRYYNRSSVQSLWRQYFQYGYWKVRVLQKHGRRMRFTHFVPPAFAAFLSIAAFGAGFSSAARVLFCLIIGTYSAVNLAVSLWVATKSKPRHWFRLALAFAVLHLSYGFGFLAGLVRFRRRWGDSRGSVPALNEGCSADV